jgi:hypothetical protein
MRKPPLRAVGTLHSGAKFVPSLEISSSYVSLLSPCSQAATIGTSAPRSYTTSEERPSNGVIS